MSLRWQRAFAWLLILAAAYGIVAYGIRTHEIEERLVKRSPMADHAAPGQVLLITKSGPFSVSQPEANAYHRTTYIQIGFLILGMMGWEWLIYVRRKEKSRTNVGNGKTQEIES